MNPIRTLATLTTLSLLVAAAATAAGPRTIKITGNDAMQYSVTRIEAKPGEQLQVTLVATGKMAKAEMAHNFVLLAAGTKVDSFVLAATTARATDYIPARKADQILAHTRMAGAGETVSVTFAAPTEPGEYVYLCTFPGHYTAGMKGVLVVK